MKRDKDLCAQCNERVYNDRLKQEHTCITICGQLTHRSQQGCDSAGRRVLQKPCAEPAGEYFLGIRSGHPPRRKDGQTVRTRGRSAGESYKLLCGPREQGLVATVHMMTSRNCPNLCKV